MKYFYLVVLFIFISISLYSNEKEYFFALPKSHQVLYMKAGGTSESQTSLFPTLRLYLLDSYINDDTFESSIKDGFFPLYDLKSPQDENDPFSSLVMPPPISFLVQRHASSFCFPTPEYYYKHISDSLVMKNNREFLGWRTSIAVFGCWEYIKFEFKNKKRNIFLASLTLENIYPIPNNKEKSYQTLLKNGNIIEIDRRSFSILNHPKVSINRKIEQWSQEKVLKIFHLLKESSQPEPGGKIKGDFNIPIMCIDPDSHSSRMDKDDWRIYTYLNSYNGDFFQYFFFEKELDYEWPLYLRDFAVDHLAGVNQCLKSTTGVPLDSKEKMVIFDKSGNFDPQKILFAYQENLKPWRPEMLPIDKNTIPKNRLFFTTRSGRIFGSYSKVWELGIWERLGMMFKLNPKAEIYLCGYGTLLQAAETKTVEEEHVLIKKCGVRMTAELYSELEKLRKSQK